MKIKFGTDGFRGVIGKDFTFETARQISLQALGFFRKKQNNTVVIGYDTRFLSREVAAEIGAVAAATGYNTLLSDAFCPSPAVSLYTKVRKANFGVMVTASHNPAIYNGIKIKENFGGSALPGTIEAVGKAPSKPQARKGGAVDICDIRASYISHMKKIFSVARLAGRGIKVLVDPLFGSAQGYMAEIFSGTDATIAEIHSELNPAFGGKSPEPVEANLEHTKKVLLNGKFDIAFAFDGDGDRIACIDEKGEFYSSQRLLPLFLHHLIKERKKGMVVKTVSTTHMLDAVARKNGVTTKQVPIGFKNIAPYFISGKALIGGEESGGIAIQGYIPERDGIFCSLFLLQIMRKEKKSLAELWNEMEHAYGRFVFQREDFHFENEIKTRKALNKIDLDRIGNLKVTEKLFLDGRKYIFADGSFLLVRVSGTEPVVRVYAEARDKDTLACLFGHIKKVLQRNGVSIS